MKLLVLDFESYFDQDYNLKKLSTEEYVRSPLFKAHMLGYWEPGRMSAPADCLPSMLEGNEEFRQAISSSAVLCHHAHFDGLILEHHFGLRPAFWLDTLSMSRLVLPRLPSHSLDALAAHFALPAKTVPYNLFRGVRQLPPDIYDAVAYGCRHDIALTYEIHKRLLALVPRDEFKVIDSTIRMFTEPCLRLDRERIGQFLKAERVRKAKAMLAAGEAIKLPWTMPPSNEGLQHRLAQIETELQSSAKFKLALESLGYPCPMKPSPAGLADNIPALAKNDEGMKELLEHEDSRVQALAAARLGIKSTGDETRAERLLSADGRGAVPVYLSYAAAKTLRFGGGDKTNWQNFRRGGEIRKSVQAPPGHKLVIGDLSQIEYRLLCWLTGQQDKLDALVAGRDLYCEFASEFYGETVTKEDKPRRGVGKQGILMGGYGAGDATMIATAAGGGYGPPICLSEGDGQRMVRLYRQGHTFVMAFWRWCDRALPILGNGGEANYRGVIRIKDHRIHLPNGTCLNYEGMRWATNAELFLDQKDDGQGYSWWEPARKGWSRMWGSKLTADIIQSLACVVIKDVMLRMLKHARPVLQVHDELVYAQPAEQAEQFADRLYEELVTPSVWCADIPLEAEVIVSERYEK